MDFSLQKDYYYFYSSNGSTRYSRIFTFSNLADALLQSDSREIFPLVGLGLRTSDPSVTGPTLLSAMLPTPEPFGFRLDPQAVID